MHGHSMSTGYGPIQKCVINNKINGFQLFLSTSTGVLGCDKFCGGAATIVPGADNSFIGVVAIDTWRPQKVCRRDINFRAHTKDYYCNPSLELG